MAPRHGNRDAGRRLGNDQKQRGDAACLVVRVDPQGRNHSQGGRTVLWSLPFVYHHTVGVDRIFRRASRTSSPGLLAAAFSRGRFRLAARRAAAHIRPPCAGYPLQAADSVGVRDARLAPRSLPRRPRPWGPRTQRRPGGQRTLRARRAGARPLVHRCRARAATLRPRPLAGPRRGSGARRVHRRAGADQGCHSHCATARANTVRPAR